jgi:CHAD domain-containing protein
MHPPGGDSPDHTADRRFDTADRRLARYGCSLHHRPGTGWVASIPRPDKLDPSARDEVVVPGRSTVRPPAEMLRLLAPLVRGASLATDVPPEDGDQYGPERANDVVQRMSARAVIRTAIDGSVDQLLLHLPAARLGRDAEGVHQARVATRRLRSDLRTFRPLLDEEWVESLRCELSWLADALGAVRDDDVLLGRLRRSIAELADVDDTAAKEILTELGGQRDRHRDALLATLDERRAIDLYDRLVAAADDPPTTGRAIGRASAWLSPLVERPWTRLERAVDRLGDDPPVGELHRVRLLAKRARYAAEAVAPAFGKQAARFAADMATIQDVLGELNDAEVMAEWLERTAHRLGPGAAFVAGRLAQQALDTAIVHRAEWELAYRDAAKPKRRAWFA